MTRFDLQAHCQMAKDQGLERCMFVLKRKRAPRNFDRVRILPGVHGRIVGSSIDGGWLVSVPLTELQQFCGEM